MIGSKLLVIDGETNMLFILEGDHEVYSPQSSDVVEGSVEVVTENVF